ncbi:HvfA family oxazolone/thioamide-modified RiPP metallophore [Lysobacter capsici]|uniref:HvfA family oxazolone/thioamide-modified RiPP metallophore n=1 Tax=Lysobacter capsici TaxID=435897 RepID=UPI00287B9DE9|nr:EF-hand domain-containing protein [Lysobacter capsici]WND80683.1 EF-hand domain-containing protein [Lysobacter capsici]WND85879.1 EF-hand domain-containing protein [Lysobacter capsici]
MSVNHHRSASRSTTAGMLGVALAGLVLGQSAFAMQPLAQGYMVAASHAAGEGKCGEGKCGADKAKSANAKAAGKTAEGKCGEGKCGDASFAKTDRSGDGRVSRAEFLAVAPTRAADFPKLDVDRDGFISEKEAYDYLKATYAANGKPMPAGLFAKFTGGK